MMLPHNSPRISPIQQHYTNLCRGSAWQHGREGIVIAIGPRGTGKTTIACHAAIDMLRRNIVEHIVLATSGSRITRSKAVAHSAPLFGISSAVLTDHVRSGRIELVHAADIASMHGRTMDNTYLIADDAHRMTPYTTYGLLMSVGHECRVVVTGSSTNEHIVASSPSLDGLSDLVARIEMSFERCDETLADIVRMTDKDIIRSDLAKRVNALYQTFNPKHYVAKLNTE